MSDTYSYEVLEPGGHARMVGNVLDRISEASANPASAVGSSRAMLGDPETASWTERTTAADGAALIESVKGNTLRWNQMVSATYQTQPSTASGITFALNGPTLTVTGTATSGTNFYFNNNMNFVGGHKYLLCGMRKYSASNVGSSFAGVQIYNTQAQAVIVRLASVGGVIFTANDNYQNSIVYANVGTAGITVDFEVAPQLFDLTAMFGAGNEPATVAEFEALFPDAYYPYDPGSLLPVRMDGIETVGFNQWDEQWEHGYYDNDTGEPLNNNTLVRTKNYVPVFPSTEYYFQSTGAHLIYYYDAGKNYIGYENFNPLSHSFTTPANAKYIRFRFSSNYGATYLGDCCINLSDPSRNGTYEPHWSSQRTIPASTYFPDGMRSAGTVRDELTETQAITRVGSRAYQSGDESDASVITDGTTTHYALATPTTTPIDPPLPMSYRVGTGGTERVMVAEGTTSAPPIFATRYPLDPADLAASIAPRESATAEANHAVGDLIMLGWTLCKVTTSIARGEAITIGTNVAQTSVAAELAALSE